MTPRNKANELIDKFFMQADNGVTKSEAKRFCRIVCDEAIMEITDFSCSECEHGRIEFWEEVKKQIDNL
jgi:hypothetical protein